MNNNTTPTDTPPDPISVNAFLIKPKKGAAKALTVVKSDLKAAGCHWHTAAGAWSCPARTKETIEALLNKNHIGVTLTPFQDDYFCKNERGQQADKVWTQIDILEERHYVESIALLVDRTAFEREIDMRGLSLEESDVKIRLEQLTARDQAQSVLMEEIAQLRNSAQLLEAAEEVTVKLPFHVLGHNVQREILIWKDGRLIALPAGRLNKDELRLYVGGDSEWFQEESAEKALKLQLIDVAHKKGFIDDQAPLKAGIWYINKRWLIISGKKAAIVEGNRLKYLEEPIFEGKLVETEGASWLNWSVVEEAMLLGRSDLKSVFNLIYVRVKQWNWLDPSMSAFVTAFVMLSIMQQAMSWRPWIYLTGAKSTGKSTFFEDILQGIYSGQVERLDKSTAHATAQTIGNSGRIPVFDEFEKHKHIPEILELAKLFNRGGQKTSGTGSDKAHRFHLHHMPWFGSIYLPKRVMQDAAQESRIIKFELKKLTNASPPLEQFAIGEGAVIAAKIVVTMILAWREIEAKAQEINADRQLFIQEHQGIEVRTVENFMYASALLAIVAPEGVEEIFPRWATLQSEDDGDKLLDTILASLIHVDGSKVSVGEMLQKAGRYVDELERYGLKIIMHKAKDFLALRCESVTRHLLKDTEYAVLDIRSPLARIEGAVGSAQVKMAGVNQRCVLIPVERILGV
jgi:hypothetical protein